ncbi:unnamed protein product [Triticum aestivum]|uniref:GDSL esterase/lipase n=3 Tax=Triticinae TaxID=1648030 RepID=A0A9R1EWH1_WHEAT|nr:GDSL esterase/lipase At5g55050-like [Aegilops tauschii subsp. strangulata]XP_044333826.1 GDSL esterase/lipase At5g55050-like [Triticum aestivum]KAF7017788.1 hypothetical protein CFC21_031162 [Triticum aestivum]SPT19448.1 unnamed protein product [Triticum aestivum]
MAGHGGPFALVALCVLELALRGACAGDAPAPAPAPAPGPERLVPAIFVFGDSTVDVGNNNKLPDCTPACRANYPKYGVDYPSHEPTGRFSNGYNLADQLAQFLGFDESPPAFQSLPEKGIARQMKNGINFASGGSGLQNKTGQKLCGQLLCMADQVGKFTSAVKKMGKGSGDLLSRSLFFISVGSNDLFEYADPDSPPPKRNDTAFLESLVAYYRGYLQDLHAAGARKFSIVSPALVGCCPSQRAIAKKHDDTDEFGCLGAANNLSRQLYPMLASMLKDLSRDRAGMNYSVSDSATMAEMIFKPGGGAGFDLTVIDTACCGGGGKCNSSAKLCHNRDNYMFWDSYHPTKAASGLAAMALFSDPGMYVHPINVEALAES